MEIKNVLKIKMEQWYISEDIDFKEGMKFKSNSCNFLFSYQ